MSLFSGLYKYKRKHLYDVAKSRKDSRLNTGYDYTETLMQNSVSSHITRNATMQVFLSFITDYIVRIIKSIRVLKAYKNYTIKKDDQYIR